MVIDKLSNIKRRILAAVIDYIILALPIAFIFASNQDINFKLYFANYYGIIPVLYFIISHYYFGQSVGKNILEIQVVDLKTEKKIDLKQAILRTLPLGIISVILFVGFFYFHITGNEQIKYFINIVGEWYITLSKYWWCIIIISILANKKRMAIHDFIAGTIVIRKVKTNLPLTAGLTPGLP